MKNGKSLAIIREALNDLKAIDVVEMDVRSMTTMTDYMIIASGRSDRHVKAIANEVVETAKKKGMDVLGIEGDKEADWVLVDCADIVVHVMLPRVRDFYNLEKLWSQPDSHMGSGGKD